MDYIVVLLLFTVFFAFVVVQSQALSGGAVADWGKYPYVVRLGIRKADGKFSICTGCAVGRHTILTAAHCIPAAARPEDIQAQLANGRELTTEEVRVNPNYAASSTKKMAYDVALIRVKEKLRHFMPVNFGSVKQVDVSETIIGGFGLDDRGRAGTFKTGRATLYDRGYWDTSRGYEGQTVCDEFEANRSLLEGSASACRRCNSLPHCSCDTGGRCMKDGSPEMVASILFGDSGGSVFYVQNNVAHSIIGVNSSVVLLKAIGASFNESIFTKTSFNEDFLRSGIAAFEGGEMGASEAEPVKRPPRPLPLAVGPTTVFAAFGLLALLVVARRGNKMEAEKPPLEVGQPSSASSSA